MRGGLQSLAGCILGNKAILFYVFVSIWVLTAPVVSGIMEKIHKPGSVDFPGDV